eukprot:jgi/Mesen1/3147/ME000184S02212
MRIFSWNVNGLPTTLLDVRNRYTCISTYFKDYLHADIVCFQEAKVQEERLDKVLACVPGYESFWAFSRTRKGYSGVVTYVREELSPLEAEADCLQGPDEDICREGRVMCTDHGTFLLFNVYVPNAGDRSEGRPRLAFKLAFLHALRRKMDEALRLGKHVILVGDLNVSYRQADVFHQWRLEDIFGPEELRWFHELLEEYVDLFHHLHPDAQDVFSVWNQKTSGRIHNEGQRIDFTICDKGFLDQVLSAEVIKMSPQKWSDHAAVAVSLTEQPALAPHAPPTLSSRHMARFREDTKQRKLTSLFGVKQLSKTSSALVRPPIVPESDREAAKTGQLDYCKEPVGKQNPQGHQAVVQANENDSYLPAVGVARPSYGEEAGAGRAVASGRSDSAVNAGNVDASSLDGVYRNRTQQGVGPLPQATSMKGHMGRKALQLLKSYWRTYRMSIM